ncbi:hypothetical protein TRIATDRAFT_284255 [Trichoderma atroviride IMI 206040]|uniref:Uncharacterized protein n=1 Tax=Hypocrea atroviridis (strain ATCC 20476 / IMI 206040) TaxID=452589 RepID=G9NWF1_HYPAI|nr:uncharacterized protein TRIATDRAFT_284255 [Trichoderma atroviride IMI 206040]EHK45309.1 hypothetical protein TRIATDRAFT_284255 [Trichoderma atroviride IMI 206040]
MMPEEAQAKAKRRRGERKPANPPLSLLCAAVPFWRPWPHTENPAPLVASHCGGGQGRLDANQVVWLAFRLRQACWEIARASDGGGTGSGHWAGTSTAQQQQRQQRQQRHGTAAIGDARSSTAPRMLVPRRSCCCSLPSTLLRYECLEHQPGRQPCGGWGLVQLAGGYHGWSWWAGFQLMHREVRARQVHEQHEWDPFHWNPSPEVVVYFGPAYSLAGQGRQRHVHDLAGYDLISEAQEI